MGDRQRVRGGRAAVLSVCSLAALGGGVLAATVTSAQGPGDYQPSTTTVTTTVVAGGGGGGGTQDDEVFIKIDLKGTAGKQTIGKAIEIKAKAKIQNVQQGTRQGPGEIFLAGYGKLALKVGPGGRGEQCKGLARPDERRWKLGNDFDTISQGQKTTLELKIPRDARKQVDRQAVCKNTKAKAKIRIRANTAEGTEGVKDRRVKVFPTGR
jgi:hypothetical protein